LKILPVLYTDISREGQQYPYSVIGEDDPDPGRCADCLHGDRINPGLWFDFADSAAKRKVQPLHYAPRKGCTWLSVQEGQRRAARIAVARTWLATGFAQDPIQEKT
jgi:hypothetical protein